MFLGVDLQAQWGQEQVEWGAQVMRSLLDVLTMRHPRASRE